MMWFCGLGLLSKSSHCYHHLLLTKLRRASSPIQCRKYTEKMINRVTYEEENFGRAISNGKFSQLLHSIGLSSDYIRQLYSKDTNNEHLIENDDKYPLAVAISGGADSMALMLLLCQYLKQLDISQPLLAITIDHGLRPESRIEAVEVSKICKLWGVHHEIRYCKWKNSVFTEEREKTIQPQYMTVQKSKLQEEARFYRYELLAEVCQEYLVKHLFVAHHQGDQLETVLLRLGRASGISGLQGIAARAILPQRIASTRNIENWINDKHNVVELVRPLLKVSKADLKATCGAFQQFWIEDPSNNALVYDRVRIRKELDRPEIYDNKVLISSIIQLQQTALNASLEFENIENKFMQRYATLEDTNVVVLKMEMLHDAEIYDELCYRVLGRIIRLVGGMNKPRRSHSLATFLNHVRNMQIGKSTTLGGCKITLVSRGSELKFERESKKHT